MRLALSGLRQAAPPGEPAASASAVLLSLKGIKKRYGETTALRGVSLEFRSGRVHGLVGENGAGKSTIVKIMSGLETPDSGEISYQGRPCSLRSPKDALELGISTVYQELTLAPKLTVAENLLMGWRPPFSRRSYDSHRGLDRAATAIMESWDLEDIPSYTTVQRLSLSDQQRLEIVRACSRQPKLLILDEPTAAVGAAAVEWLNGLVAKLATAGSSVVYISHRLDEIRSSCSDLTVLRDGQQVASLEHPRDVPEREIVRMIAGREIEKLEAGSKLPKRPGAKVQLEARSLRVGRQVADVSLELKEGEIVGVAALEGSGQRELFLALFGAVPLEAGSIEIGGRPVKLRSPRDAVSAGLALVPEDRKAGGLLLESSNAVNVALPSLKNFQRFGVYRARKVRHSAAQLLASLAVKYSSVDENVGSLSGGNQQKVVLAKWLLAGSRVYLMYDPTRGVDPATKIDMYSRIRELAESGRSVLLYSSEMEEVLNLSTRVVVLYKGRIVRNYPELPVSEEQVVSAMLGMSESPS